MKIKEPSFFQTDKKGILMLDAVVALGIFVVAIMPLAFSFIHESKLIRAEYHRAVAMEIVDGEMEILAAGAWKQFPEGTHDYSVHLKAAADLPPGQFQLDKTGNHLRLEWKSDRPAGIGAVVREITIK